MPLIDRGGYGGYSGPGFSHHAGLAYIPEPAENGRTRPAATAPVVCDLKHVRLPLTAGNGRDPKACLKRHTAALKTVRDQSAPLLTIARAYETIADHAEDAGLPARVAAEAWLRSWGLAQTGLALKASLDASLDSAAVQKLQQQRDYAHENLRALLPSGIKRAKLHAETFAKTLHRNPALSLELRRVHAAEVLNVAREEPYGYSELSKRIGSGPFSAIIDAVRSRGVRLEPIAEEHEKYIG